MTNTTPLRHFQHPHDQVAAADAVLSTITDPQFQAEAELMVTERLIALDNAWDAPAYSDPRDWRREQAKTAVTEILTLLGFGTPTMRGEHCRFMFPDGSFCTFGRHHRADYHHSPNGDEQPVMMVR